MSSYRTDPASRAIEITPSDSERVRPTRALYVGVGGDLSVSMLDSGSVVFANVQDGSVLPIRVERVHSFGTTASSIVGLY